MAVKKQLDFDASDLPEAASDWFRQFLKHLELFMVETGQPLRPDSDSAEYQLAAMRAVKLTLLDSGMDDEKLRNLFGRVAIEDPGNSPPLQWNAELNKRRFELIDGDIQGTLSPAQQIELAGLTQLMRDHVDSEANLPLAGARKLHRLLTNMDSESADLEQ